MQEKTNKPSIRFKGFTDACIGDNKNETVSWQ